MWGFKVCVFRDVGFRVRGLGVLGFRVYGCGVQGLRIRVQTMRYCPFKTAFQDYPRYG